VRRGGTGWGEERRSRGGPQRFQEGQCIKQKPADLPLHAEVSADFSRLTDPIETVLSNLGIAFVDAQLSQTLGSIRENFEAPDQHIPPSKAARRPAAKAPAKDSFKKNDIVSEEAKASCAKVGETGDLEGDLLASLINNDRLLALAGGGACMYVARANLGQHELAAHLDAAERHIIFP
jgi:hypothetical protein